MTDIRGRVSITIGDANYTEEFDTSLMRERSVTDNPLYFRRDAEKILDDLTQRVLMIVQQQYGDIGDVEASRAKLLAELKPKPASRRTPAKGARVTTAKGDVV